MSFADPEDLATYLQAGQFDDEQEASAQLALDIATAVVVERVGQTLEMVLGDVVTLEPHGEDLHLPQRPVTAVHSVTTRNRGYVATTARTLNTEYEVRGSRLRWVGIGTWPYEVTVTYDHGFLTIPDDIKGATLAVAAELFNNPEGLSRSAIDDASDVHEWTDDSPAERMLKLVARKYGRKALTVRLG